MLQSRFLGLALATAILAAHLPTVSAAGAQASAQRKGSDSNSKPMEGQSARANGGVVTPSSPARRQEETLWNVPEYRIGPGDVLEVDVWKEPDAGSPAVVVRPDGKISVGILGEVQAAGLMPSELQKALSDRYMEFIRDARVTVKVKEINSQKVYVIGEVKKEGAIRLQGPMTVLQALAETGGVTDYAKRRKIHILRIVHGRRVILLFDYDAVVRGWNMEQNIVLSPGDTIIVPR